MAAARASGSVANPGRGVGGPSLDLPRSSLSERDDLAEKEMDLQFHFSDTLT